jgi:hypothetical protein
MNAHIIVRRILRKVKGNDVPMVGSKLIQTGKDHVLRLVEVGGVTKSTGNRREEVARTVGGHVVRRREKTSKGELLTFQHFLPLLIC